MQADLSLRAFPWWLVARLTASSKERLLISGVGIDRLAAMVPAAIAR